MEQERLYGPPQWFCNAYIVTKKGAVMSFDSEQNDWIGTAFSSIEDYDPGEHSIGKKKYEAVESEKRIRKMFDFLKDRRTLTESWRGKISNVDAILGQYDEILCLEGDVRCVILDKTCDYAYEIIEG